MEITATRKALTRGRTDQVAAVLLI